jgi:hypothetical protein
MRIWFILFVFCMSSLAHALPIQDHQLPTEELWQLASGLGIESGSDLIAETQKHWLRKPGQERWEMAELSPELKKFVIHSAEKMGLYAPWTPTCTTYDKALILGTTVPLMKKRLNYLKDLWNQGIRFNEIVWLTGERPLDPQMDGLSEHYNNEAEAAKWIWKETSLPEEMHKLPAVFIAVPMKGTKRPNTEDSIIAWLNTSPQPSKALFVSDQPFNGYQFAVVKTNLPDAFAFDLVGPGVDPNCHPAAAAITLDTIARWMYQENIYRSSRSLEATANSPKATSGINRS